MSWKTFQKGKSKSLSCGERSINPYSFPPSIYSHWELHSSTKCEVKPSVGCLRHCWFSQDSFSCLLVALKELPKQNDWITDSTRSKKIFKTNHQPDQPSLITKCRVHTSLKYLQGSTTSLFQNLTTLREEIISNIQSKPSWLQLETVSSHPITSQLS